MTSFFWFIVVCAAIAVGCLALAHWVKSVAQELDVDEHDDGEGW